MAYEYRPRDCAEALPRDISSFTTFIEEQSKHTIEVAQQVAEQVNMKPVSQSVEALETAMKDAVKLFQSMLGEQNDGPKTGTLYGLKKLADAQAELQN